MTTLWATVLGAIIGAIVTSIGVSLNERRRRILQNQDEAINALIKVVQACMPAELECRKLRVFTGNAREFNDAKIRSIESAAKLTASIVKALRETSHTGIHSQLIESYDTATTLMMLIEQVSAKQTGKRGPLRITASYADQIQLDSYLGKIRADFHTYSHIIQAESRIGVKFRITRTEVPSNIDGLHPSQATSIAYETPLPMKIRHTLTLPIRLPQMALMHTKAFISKSKQNDNQPAEPN